MLLGSTVTDVAHSPVFCVPLVPTRVDEAVMEGVISVLEAFRLPMVAFCTVAVAIAAVEVALRVGRVHGRKVSRGGVNDCGGYKTKRDTGNTTRKGSDHGVYGPTRVRLSVCHMKKLNKTIWRDYGINSSLNGSSKLYAKVLHNFRKVKRHRHAVIFCP